MIPTNPLSGGKSDGKSAQPYTPISFSESEINNKFRSRNIFDTFEFDLNVVTQPSDSSNAPAEVQDIVPANTPHEAQPAVSAREEVSGSPASISEKQNPLSDSQTINFSTHSSSHNAAYDSDATTFSEMCLRDPTLAFLDSWFFPQQQSPSENQPQQQIDLSELSADVHAAAAEPKQKKLKKSYPYSSKNTGGKKAPRK